jgi:hypothetical protein
MSLFFYPYFQYINSGNWFLLTYLEKTGDEILNAAAYLFQNFQVELDWQWVKQITKRCFVKLNSVTHICFIYTNWPGRLLIEDWKNVRDLKFP